MWQKIWLLYHYNTLSHTLIHRLFYLKQHSCHPLLILLAWLGPPETFFFSLDWRSSWKAVSLIQLRWSKQKRRQCWTSSWNTISRTYLKSGRIAGRGMYVWNGTTSRVMATNRLKWVFYRWQHQSCKFWIPPRIPVYVYESNNWTGHHNTNLEPFERWCYRKLLRVKWIVKVRVKRYKPTLWRGSSLKEDTGKWREIFWDRLVHCIQNIQLHVQMCLY